MLDILLSNWYLPHDRHYGAFEGNDALRLSLRCDVCSRLRCPPWAELTEIVCEPVVFARMMLKLA